jgi:hypothetical protein
VIVLGLLITHRVGAKKDVEDVLVLLKVANLKCEKLGFNNKEGCLPVCQIGTSVDRFPSSVVELAQASIHARLSRWRYLYMKRGSTTKVQLI